MRRYIIWHLRKQGLNLYQIGYPLRSFRIFNMIDDYNRERLGIEAGLSLSALRVIRALERH